MFLVSCYLALLAVFLGDLFEEPKPAKLLIAAGCSQAGTCTHKQREESKISTCFNKGRQRAAVQLSGSMPQDTNTCRWASEVIWDYFHYLRCCCFIICQLASDSLTAGKMREGSIRMESSAAYCCIYHQCHLVENHTVYLD